MGIRYKGDKGINIKYFDSDQVQIEIDGQNYSATIERFPGRFSNIQYAKVDDTIIILVSRYQYKQMTNK